MIEEKSQSNSKYAIFPFLLQLPQTVVLPLSPLSPRSQIILLLGILGGAPEPEKLPATREILSHGR